MNSRAFTLIELIVVVAVLAIVIAAAVGVFISIISHQRILMEKQELLSETSYVVEHMSKALRMAAKNNDPQNPNSNCIPTDEIYDVTDNGSHIKFINQSEDADYACEEFFLSNGELIERKGGIEKNIITSGKFTIDTLKFYTGAGSPQPRVTLLLKIKSQGSQDLVVQTTVSQRNLNTSQ